MMAFRIGVNLLPAIPRLATALLSSLLKASLPPSSVACKKRSAAVEQKALPLFVLKASLRAGNVTRSENRKRFQPDD